MSLGMSMLELEGRFKARLECVCGHMRVNVFVYAAIGLAICLPKCHILPTILYPDCVVFGLLTFIPDSMQIAVVAVAAVGTALLA